MAKTPKASPKRNPLTKAHRARKRQLIFLRRLAVQEEKAERAVRHAAIDHEPRAGKPRTRRASRR